MSVEALTWALNAAPTDSTTDAMVLVGLANHADPDGRNAFPSVERLATYGRMSRRAVQLALRRLEDAGVIRRGHQGAAAAYIGRADRRPVVYDLALELTRPQPVDEPEDGAHQLHPVDATGRTSRHHGAHLTTSRGEPRSPEPSLTVMEPTRAQARARSSSTREGQGQPPPRPPVVVYDPTEAARRFAELTGEAP